MNTTLGREDSLFGNLTDRVKSTPMKKGAGDVKIDMSSDSVSFITKEKGEDEQKMDESYGKRKRSNSDDSLMMIITGNLFYYL